MSNNERLPYVPEADDPLYMNAGSSDDFGAFGALFMCAVVIGPLLWWAFS